METLLICFFLIMIFYAGFALGKIHTFLFISSLLKKVAKEQGIDIESELRKAKERDTSPDTPTVYKLDIEKHGDILYLFDVESNSFICQGKTIEELCDLAKQHKNVLYAAVRHGDKVFRFKDGISTEVV